MTRRLETELEAWEYLAKRFSKNANRKGGVRVGNDVVDCLCHAVYELNVAHWVKDVMLRRIEWEMLRAKRRVYLYPLSASGARLRARFCLRMAKEYKKRYKECKKRYKEAAEANSI